MSIRVFVSNSKGDFFGFNRLRTNLAGSWYWQFWIGKFHVTIGNAK